MNGPADESYERHFMMRRRALIVHRVIVLLMLLMSLTLAVASAVHFGVRLAGLADAFPGAAPPEAILAVVMAAGTAAAWRGSARARTWALGATLVTVAGFLLGLRFTLFGGREHATGDVVYHLAGFAVLLGIVALLLTRQGRRALDHN